MHFLIAALACLTAAAQTAPTPKELTDKQWVLFKLDREAVDSTIRSTVVFAADDRASGVTGCNRWFGKAMFEATSLSFSPVGTTRMACSKPQMDRETAFTRVLSLTRSWSLSGGELSLAGEDGALLAVFRSEPPQGGRK